MRRRTALALLLSVLSLAAITPALAGLSRAEIGSVGFDDRAGLPLPANAVTLDASGLSKPFGERLGGQPALVAFVDYTCQTVCGVAVNALAAAEAELRQRSDLAHKVLVLGFDPHDEPADRAQWLSQNGEAATLGKAAFLMADDATVARLVEAAGLRTVYDAERDQYAHPAGALLIDNEGRIVRALDLVSLEPETLRLALIEASGGTAGTFYERAILSCYGWNAQTGRYAPLISVTLTASAILTVAAILTFVGFFLWKERRSRTDGEERATGRGDGSAARPILRKGAPRA